MASESGNGNGKRCTDPLIETHALGYSIDGRHTLRDVSLILREGEMVGLIGPNGAGKTTLLKVLGGLWKATSGTLSLMSKPPADYSPREVARLVAHVPQSTVTDFAFTAREIVLMGRSPYLGRFEIERPVDRQIAVAVMQTMDIEGVAERLIGTLSGGERQRVFVARALAQQPHVLLLDEPTANLDVGHQLDLLSLVVKLAHEEGLGIIAAVHDLDLAAHFCDRLILLHEGQVLAEGAPQDVLTPNTLASAFGVQAQVYRDPFNQSLRLSLARNGHHTEHASVPMS